MTRTIAPTPAASASCPRYDVVTGRAARSTTTMALAMRRERDQPLMSSHSPRVASSHSSVRTRRTPHTVAPRPLFGRTVYRCAETGGASAPAAGKPSRALGRGVWIVARRLWRWLRCRPGHLRRRHADAHNDPIPVTLAGDPTTTRICNSPPFSLGDRLITRHLPGPFCSRPPATALAVDVTPGNATDQPGTRFA